MNDLIKLIERELDVHEMVLTDPLTLRRLKAERIARAVTSHFDQMSATVPPWPDICTFVTQEQADAAVASMLDAGIPVG